MSFAAITLCVASQRVFIVVSVYFLIDSVRKRLDTPSYLKTQRLKFTKMKFNVMVGKPEGKRPLGRPRHRCEGSTRTDLKEKGWEGADWIHLAQGTDQWRTLVNKVMNLRVSKKAWNY
jgi:hypothetical protein